MEREQGNNIIEKKRKSEAISNDSSDKDDDIILLDNNNLKGASKEDVRKKLTEIYKEILLAPDALACSNFGYKTLEDAEEKSKQRQALTMAILRQYPEFLVEAETAQFGVMEPKFPLELLLLSQQQEQQAINGSFSRENIVEVIELSKKHHMVEYAEEEVNNPIHSLCRYSETLHTDGLFEYCLKDMPQEWIGQVNELRHLPLDYLLGRMSSAACEESRWSLTDKVALLDKLLDPCPEMLGNDKSNTLHHALSGQHGIPIMKYLFEKHAPVCTKFTLEEYRYDRHDAALDFWDFQPHVELGHEAALAVGKLVPHAKDTLDFAHRIWTEEGYVQLLKSFQHHNPDLQHLKVPLWPQYLANDLDATTALPRFIENAHSLKSLEFLGPDTAGPLNDALLLVHCVSSNPSVLELTLKHFHFSSYCALSALFSRLNQRQLMLRHVSVDGPWTRCNFVHCNVRVLSITNSKSNFNSEWFRGFVNQLSELPKLVDLELNDHDHDNITAPLDITDAMVSLLEKNLLESLRLDEFTNLDRERLLNALKTNTSLSTLSISPSFASEALELLASVLENYNSSLRNVAYTRRNSAGGRQVLYWTALNSHGRGRVRGPGCTDRDIVDCLLDIQREYYVEQTLQLQYGLLLECPGVWSAQFG